MFNVFKRPMFKRGGSTQGTGIMSHVEPRKNFNIGTFPYDIDEQLYANQFPVPQIPQKQTIGQKLFRPAPKETSLFYKVAGPATKTGRERIEEEQKNLLNREGIFTAESLGASFPSEEGITSIVPKPKEEIIIPPPVEKEPKYTESDILSSVEDEKRILDKILPDNVSTAEKAFLFAKAMEGETIADKLNIAKEEGTKLAKGKSARDREKALLAYRGATQKDIAKTQAGKKGSTEKQLDELTNLYKIVNDPKSTEAQKKAANAKLEIKKQVYNILSPKTNQGISNVDKQLLNELGKSAAKLKRLSIDPTSDGYKKALDEYRLTRRAVSKNPTLLDIIQLTDQQVGLEFKKDGGRIGYALGTENPMTTRPAVGQVPTEETSKLSFEDLRNRLPKEITDGVVRLISSSDQALQDFSYIRTQGDVVKFNQKYGVNLVLPAEA
jgi:hypothetical protein